jgi:hypothetical protein
VKQILKVCHENIEFMLLNFMHTCYGERTNLLLKYSNNLQTNKQ